ncbi:MAG: glycosyl hydrolase 115 family protein [Treponema sp.]|nr:glycosyl hydrolase 115 family protein [Treponema sp.]
MNCITSQTVIEFFIHTEQGGTEPLPAPVALAAKDVRRDIAKTCTKECTAKTTLGIRLYRKALLSEQFSVKLEEGALSICASDDLGFIYGLYHISRELLGIHDFWFWNDQHFEPREKIPLPEGYSYESRPKTVRYRGWFINDEILINAWQVEGSSELPWIMAFEALLRAGGNMVIPGTDHNSRRYRALAASRGLYITHHHAEPLGAEMFIRAYPELEPSYALHPELFHNLWKQSIQEQGGMHVVWNLGFRGQGDYPFWHNDPSYDTDEKRGALVSKLIKMQYDMVKAAHPDADCCTNLYGEVMELYQKGCLTLPDDVIKIWADNGFGKMVSRRQGNHNPRVPSMPDATGAGCKGIYYHVSFFDLQAANHITMLPNSAEFVCRELNAVLENGGKDYWIINCSNIKPHVYFLDLVASLWNGQNACADSSGDGAVDCRSSRTMAADSRPGASPEELSEAHRTSYVRRYYGDSQTEKISALFKEYAEAAAAYGPNEDDHAGEQFSTYVARTLLCQYIKNPAEPASSLFWLTGNKSLKEQAAFYKTICDESVLRYQALVTHAEKTALMLQAENTQAAATAKTLLEDSILLQAKLHLLCYTGAGLATASLLRAADGETERAFFLAGKAKEAYEKANGALRNSEHGKWAGFYANECFADVKFSAQVLAGFMAHLRMIGDGPDFYRWQREYTYSAGDKNVMTLLLWENRLTDDEMYKAMKARLDS